MNLSELDGDTVSRLVNVLRILEQKHAVRIDFDSINSINDALGLLREAQSIKRQIIEESAFNAYHTNPQYNKMVLIQEAMRIYLREVAPNRRLRKKKKSRGTL